MDSDMLIVSIGYIAAGILIGSVLKYFFGIVESKQAREHWLRKSLFMAAKDSVLIIAIGYGLRGGVGAWEFSEAMAGIESMLLVAISVIVSVGYGVLAYKLIDIPDTFLTIRAAKTPSKVDDMLAPILRRVLHILVVAFVILQVAHVVSGKEIGAIVAGLGIGGLAIALAAQDTVKNFFGATVIFAEKPFDLGERINFEGHDGVIESVGLRSTRMRRLDGHLVTIPNASLANSVIHNIAKRPYIRRIFNIGITYDTPPEKVKEAKAILEDVLKDHEGMEADFPPRVYFNNFEASSLNFICIYWYHPPAYWDYMAFTEWVNTEVHRRFNEAGIDFAFPTQTVHLAGDPDRPLNIGGSGMPPV
ncbi:MAG: mechanosensitive ion channel family protein [Opitutales bacterium]